MSSRPLLLGHRGARATTSIPENTIASFDLALAHGCDGFEFDVRLTADGRAVLCHDPKVEGIEVARADAGALEHLPELGQVLARYSKSAFLDIELKVGEGESLVLAEMRSRPPGSGYVISSFLPDVLRDFAVLDSTVPLGLICDQAEELSRWPDLPINYVIPHQKLVTRELIEQIHGSDKKFLVWTVNDREAMKRFADWKADGIISDDTELLVETLGET
jgi:glycerophosphoryl diester phosphodiesterase